MEWNFLNFLATFITSARCWVAGYGQGAFGSTSTQSILQQVEVPLVDQTTCQNQLRTTRLGSGFILDPTRWVLNSGKTMGRLFPKYSHFSFLCAGGISGRDACTGKIEPKLNLLWTSFLKFVKLRWRRFRSHVSKQWSMVRRWTCCLGWVLIKNCDLSKQEFNDNYLLIGIGCGAQSIPGVYMNVTNYISWIQATTVQA